MQDKCVINVCVCMCVLGICYCTCIYKHCEDGVHVHVF